MSPMCLPGARKRDRGMRKKTRDREIKGQHSLFATQSPCLPIRLTAWSPDAPFQASRAVCGGRRGWPCDPIQKRLPSDVLSLAVLGNRANPLPLAARRVAAHPRLDARDLAHEPVLDPFPRVEEIVPRSRNSSANAESRPDAFGEKELLTRLDKNRRRQFPKSLGNWRRRLFLARDLAQIKRSNGQ
jgi:hypothetical protein